MSRTVRFTAPRQVDVVDVDAGPVAPGSVRVQTLASGISAGTEMSAYRGTNPHLTSTWDPVQRLFTDAHPESPTYPIAGFGYSEVGRVVEVVPDPAVAGPRTTCASATSCGASGVTAPRPSCPPRRCAGTGCRRAWTP